MKILKGQEEKNAMNYIMITRELAKQSKCKDHKCGSIIVKDNKIIGQGFNSPPKNLESQRLYYLKTRTCAIDLWISIRA